MFVVVAYENSACTRSVSAPGAVSAAATPGLGAASGADEVAAAV